MTGDIPIYPMDRLVYLPDDISKDIVRNLINQVRELERKVTALENELKQEGKNPHEFTV